MHSTSRVAPHRASPTPSLIPARPPWPGLYVLLLAGFVTIFDLFVVNVAIPSMRVGLSASFAQVGFILAAYELAFGVLLMTGGRLGDRYGRRKLFVIGMAGFTLASALCGVATSANFLVAARVLQGLAAALLFPQVYASIRVNFEGDASRRAFGLLGMTLGFAAIAGQVLGGWLVHADLFGLGWRSIFLINIPIGALAIVFARAIPETRAPKRPGLDWAGVVLISLGLSLLLVPLIEGPNQGWPRWSLMSIGAAVLVLVVFYRFEERRRQSGEEPLIDMRLLTQRRFSLGGVLVLLIYSTSTSFFLCFALLMQTGFGFDAFFSGSIFAVAGAGFMLASMTAPWLVTRWGSGAIASGGLFYALALGILIAQVAWSGTQLNPLALLPVLFLVGAGQGLIMTPLLNLVLGFVAPAQAGMASGIIATLQQLGAALGVAVVGMLFTAGLHTQARTAELPAQYVTAFVNAMLYNQAAAVLAFVLLLRLAKWSRPTGIAAPAQA